MGFINILLTFMSALFWGVLAGLLTTGILMWLIHEFMKVPKMLIAIWGFFMLLFLSFQYTAWIGAGKAKTYIETAAATVDSMNSFLKTDQSDATCDWEVVTDEYPMLKPFLGKDQIDVSTISNQSLSAKEMFVWVANGLINAYMWRRFFWILGGSVVAMIGISFARRPKRYKTSSSYSSGRGASTIKF